MVNLESSKYQLNNRIIKYDMIKYITYLQS